MFMKVYHLSFMASLGLGTIIAVSSSSWFSSWLGLELNLMMMIPLIINKFNSLSTESAIKYFLVQAMSSTLFIMFSLLSVCIMKMNFLFNSEMYILITLVIKAGIPPFHFWFPQVMELMEWKQCLILLTWQKVAPFFLMSFMSHKIMWIFMLTSALVGSLGGFNQNSMKKILTYSSIIHSGWMLSIMVYNFKMWMNYFLIYSIISLSIIIMNMNFYVTDIKTMMKKNVDMSFKFLFSMNMMSLAGLPPFLGFLGKFMVTSVLLYENINKFILLTLIISSLVSLFFYLKVIYTLITLNSTKVLFFMKENKNLFSSSLILVFSTMTNIIIPTMVFLI